MFHIQINCSRSRLQVFLGFVSIYWNVEGAAHQFLQHGLRQRRFFFFFFFPTRQKKQTITAYLDWVTLLQHRQKPIRAATHTSHE